MYESSWDFEVFYQKGTFTKKWGSHLNMTYYVEANMLPRLLMSMVLVESPLAISRSRMRYYQVEICMLYTV